MVNTSIAPTIVVIVLTNRSIFDGLVGTDESGDATIESYDAFLFLWLLLTSSLAP